MNGEIARTEHDHSSSSDMSVPCAEEIQKQTARILSSPAFEASDRIKEFLSFVVEETLAGREDELKGHMIATKVFGRGDDFDAAHDPVVRMEARKLRTALDNYYLRDGTGDPILIQIPKGGYAPIFEFHTATTASLHCEFSDPKIVVMPFDLLSDDANQGYLAGRASQKKSRQP